MTQNEIKLRYYHNIEERYSLGISYQADETVVVYALCNSKDQFNRKIARSILNGRARLNIASIIPKAFSTTEERKLLFGKLKDIFSDALFHTERTTFLDINIPKALTYPN